MRAILFKVYLTVVLVWVNGEAEGEERLHYILGKVRVFYSVSGDSAVPTQDLDGNGTPDRVEDVAIQVWAAREFYCGHLGFPDPLKSERFGKVDCIQVSIHSKERIDGLNGVAYRKAQKARPVDVGNSEDRALVLAVANTVDPRQNPTPAHEFFHLIQYGTTYFSNSWFLEGMARWSEAVWRESGSLAVGLARPSEWKLGDEMTKELFGMRYNAATAFWNPLAVSFEKEVGPDAKAENIPDSLQTLEYSDGSLVMHEANLAGAALMNEILGELAEIDDRASKEMGYRDWTLANQGAVENNPFLFEGVREVLRRHDMAPK